MDQNVIQLLKTDYQFALKFALDNNFPAIQIKLAEKGYVVSNSVEAFSKIIEILQSNKDVKYFFNVPYIDSATNGTGGYSAYFVANSAPPTTPTPAAGTTNRTFNWSGLLTTIGIVLTGAGVAIGGTGAGGTTETADQKAARLAAEAAAAAKKKRNIIIGISVGGALLLALTLWLVLRKKTK